MTTKLRFQGVVRVSTYHIFTNGRDEWLDDYRQAVALFNLWAKECGCTRLYAEITDENGETLNEDCLMAVGDFPY